MSRWPELCSTHEIVEGSASTTVGVPRRSWVLGRSQAGSGVPRASFCFGSCPCLGATRCCLQGASDRLRTTGGEQSSPAARPPQPAAVRFVRSGIHFRSSRSPSEEPVVGQAHVGLPDAVVVGADRRPVEPVVGGVLRPDRCAETPLIVEHVLDADRGPAL